MFPTLYENIHKDIPRSVQLICSEGLMPCSRWGEHSKDLRAIYSVRLFMIGLLEGALRRTVEYFCKRRVYKSETIR
jgi:hypothetical protein